ncbi:Fe-S oxidoreductase [Pyrobaculum oguniense TE7]|uniref:Fe-S oxidoreductase n=1 Tax=Pyrobaculum oguniense (strain DSM 13380 / JCM 10595 / TE7) TaxID=698757 RepID=H6Q857_PYROT|nr:Fe-S oxidoreductase [Pyrobaculum oguniense TE7]
MRKVAYKKNAMKIALLYPSTYSVAMSSSIYHVLYFKLQDAGFYVERFTADRGPRGVEDGTPLSHFDHILATVHYELDYINLVKMLIDAGIPPEAGRRKKPKLIIGGPPVTANPEPLAEFADALALGELEALWEPLLAYLSTGEEAEGLYYPARGAQPVSIAYTPDVSEVDYRRLPEPEAAFSISIEAARGCPFSCLFCMESYITKPYRPRDWITVVNEAERLYKKFGVRPSLVALTANSHPHFKEILRAAVERGLPLSLPSLRAELLDDEALELIARLGQRTLTIAPEASERLRKALGKNFTNQDVIRVAKKASQLGLKVKLYLMVGLPCEKESDLKEVVELAKQVKRVGAYLYLSVNPFVPKPQTPLQYHPMAPLGYLRKSLNEIRKAPHDEYSQYDATLAAIQAAISLGGREVSRHIEASANNPSPLGYWKSLLRRGELDYVFKPREHPLPWEHVRGFYQPGELRKRYEKFLEETCA